MKPLLLLNLFSQLLMFPAVSLAGLAAPVANSGEFYLKEIRNRLPIELHQMYGQPGLTREEDYLLQDLMALAVSPPEFRFLSGSDPLFQLHPVEPKRTAVTTANRRSPIFFNLDLIGRNFTLAEAFLLVIHELGHKVHPDIKKNIPDYSFVVDRFASKIAHARTAYDLEASGRNFTLRIHSSFPEEKPSLNDDPSERFDQHLWPLITLENKEGIFPISPILFANYLRVNADKADNRIFAALVIRDWEVTESRISLNLSYRLHKKNSLSRYQNRYLEQLQFQIDGKGNISPADAIPDYPLYALPHTLRLEKEAGEAILQLKFLEYWYGDLSETKMLALIDGKKRLLDNSEVLSQEKQVKFVFTKSLGKKVEILGFHIRYSKHPADRDSADDTYFPYDRYFIPVKEAFVFTLP